MKNFRKIFCVLLGMMILMSSVTTFYAAEENTIRDVEEAFRNYCDENQPHIDGKENEVVINETLEVDNVVIFSADSWHKADHGRIMRIVGNWEIESYQTHFPYDLGLYVFSENEIFTIEDAVTKGIVTDIYEVNNFYGRRVANTNTTEKCIEAFLKHKDIATSDELWVECTVYGNIRDNIVFRADIQIEGTARPCICSDQVIGEYYFMHGYVIGPEDNPTGLYVLLADGSVVSALEAYENGLVTDKELADTAGATSKYDPHNQYRFDKIIIPKIKEEYIADDGATEITYYREIFEYYSEENDAENEESTPDYVLIDLTTNLYFEMPVADILGDCLLSEFSGNIPFVYGYAIFIPESEEIYDLTYALTLDIEGIDEATNHIGFDQLIGDTDGDRQLTIKDATYLQKCLAGIENFSKNDDVTGYFFESEMNTYISDYNRDGDRNIRDVTAIQKRLANITE